MGVLRFPSENLVLDRKVANFVADYRPRRPVSEIPKVTITSGPPVVNGVAVRNPTAVAAYPQGVPDVTTGLLLTVCSINLKQRFYVPAGDSGTATRTSPRPAAAASTGSC